MLLDDTLFPAEPPLREEDFSSPLLGRVFARLWQARTEGRTVALPLLAGELSTEEMSHITAICQRPESLKNGGRALADYIRVIQKEAEKRSGSKTDPLLAAAEKYKDKKGEKRNVK